jgi:hypothetical protein
MSSIKKPGKVNPPPKITRAQISANANANTVKKEIDKKEKVVTHLDEPLEENINRLKIEGEEARTITEAISILRLTINYLIFQFSKITVYLHVNAT